MKQSKLFVLYIALSTGDEKNGEQRKEEPDRSILGVRKNIQPDSYFEDEAMELKNDEQDEPSLPEKEISFRHSEFLSSGEKKDKPKNLQALVDAIGNRMRDIEHVVKKMSEKVHHTKPGEPEASAERQSKMPDLDVPWRKSMQETVYSDSRLKNHNIEGEHQVRAVTAGGEPAAADDAGYFSDASNIVFRKEPPAEPALTYMAPIDARGRASRTRPAPAVDKKRKKQMRKKKKSKGGKTHKKHRIKDGKKKKGFNSAELVKNVLSLEDSGSIITK